MQKNQDQILRAQFLKLNKAAKYGTAGFRDLATSMPFIAYRVGAFVATLNRSSPSLCLGVVISASHNKIQDNGVKIANFSGNMLQMQYEPLLQAFVSEQNLQTAVENFKNYLTEKKLPLFQDKVQIFIGGDTRPSTPSLLQLVSKGVQSQNCEAINFGLTTTPQLQYYVYLYNKVIKPNSLQSKPQPQKMRGLFWQNFCNYFKKGAKYLGWNNVVDRSIDCANGVGGKIMPKFNQLLTQYFNISLFNNSKDDLLNNKCGADHVKTNKTFPSQYEYKNHNSFVSYDGDADRIVFYIQEQKQLKLIDGDRQGTILTQFYNCISKQLKQKTQNLNSKGKLKIQVPTSPKIGFVQTYYANYSSSQYLKKQYNMQPVFAATGVKYLHQKAQKYDIGIYFQANGHGTVIFNHVFLSKFQALITNKQAVIKVAKDDKDYIQLLRQYFQFVQFYLMCCKLPNPSVGDAITNFLLFQIALKYLKKDYKDSLKLYTDLKSKTSKIAVKHKQLLKVTDIQDKVVQPVELQNNIQNILNKHQGKKAFLRASGTQNVLRLHVQAQTVDQVQKITQQVTELVQQNQIIN